MWEGGCGKYYNIFGEYNGGRYLGKGLREYILMRFVRRGCRKYYNIFFKIFGEEVLGRMLWDIFYKGPAELAPGRGSAAPPTPEGCNRNILMRFGVNGKWVGYWEMSGRGCRIILWCIVEDNRGGNLWEGVWGIYSDAIYGGEGFEENIIIYLLFYFICIFVIYQNLISVYLFLLNKLIKKTKYKIYI